jgi:hypothetical protein
VCKVNYAVALAHFHLHKQLSSCVDILSVAQETVQLLRNTFSCQRAIQLRWHTFSCQETMQLHWHTFSCEILVSIVSSSVDCSDYEHKIGMLSQYFQLQFWCALRAHFAQLRNVPF